jgi:hypothetical protein
MWGCAGSDILAQVKRHWLWILIVFAIVASVVTAGGVLRARVLRARRKQELAAETQAALMYYSQNLRPGLARKQVEDYLQRHNTRFSYRCCSEGRTAYATTVKVGEDDVPWYCSEAPVYVFFEFRAVDSAHYGIYNPNPDDVLDEIHLHIVGEGCL